MKTSEHFQGHLQDEVASFLSEDMSLFSVPRRKQENLNFLGKRLIKHAECTKKDSTSRKPVL